MEHPAPTVVVDVGSYSTKIGLGSSSTPECVPNLAGTFKYRRAVLPVKKSADVSISPDSLVVGKAVERYRGLLRLTYPVEYGTVKHWPAMEAILHQAKQSLHHPSAETTSTTASWSAQHNADSYVALVEAPVASRKQRQRLVECLLEGGAAGEGPRGIFCGAAPLLALYSTGSMTGLALEVGEGVVSTAAAVQGFAITAAMQREDVGGATGSALTTHLERLMRQHGTWQSLAAPTTTTGAGSESEEERIRQGRALGDLLGTANGREVVRGVKERCCRVSPTPLPNLWSCLARSTHAERGGSTAELHAAVQLGARGEAARPQLHRLPDGTEILVGSEAMYAPEVLFNPALIGGEGRSISEILHATWQQADLELRPQLLENVVLTGGTSLVTGFGARVLNELLQLAPREQKVRVVAPAERGHAAWTGAAMLSQLSTFATDMVVSRAEYLEHGEAILQSRLFA